MLGREALARDFRLDQYIDTVSNKKPEEEEVVTVTEKIPKISRYLLSINSDPDMIVAASPITSTLR